MRLWRLRAGLQPLRDTFGTQIPLHRTCGKRQVEVFGLPSVAHVKFGQGAYFEACAQGVPGSRSWQRMPPVRCSSNSGFRPRAGPTSCPCRAPTIGDYVVIHPFAGWKLQGVARSGVRRTGGSAWSGRMELYSGFSWEEEKDGTLPALRQQFAGNRSVCFASSLSLLGSAVLISGSSLFVGNDSGPLHLAAALGVPAVGLFGPSDPSLTAPCAYSPSSWLYHRVECSPCDQRKCVRPGNPCMNAISVDEVLAAAVSLQRSGAHA